MQIQNIQDTYYILTAISAVVILTLSFLLASIRLPQNIECLKFNSARRYLSLSYFILGLSGLISSVLPNEACQPTEMLLITACVASFQSLLFTSTHIVFVQPDAIRKKIVLNHFFGILGYSIFLGLSYQNQWLDNYGLYAAILVPYLAQQIYYVRKFHQFHHECVLQMEHYYDEEQDARLKWINYSFYSALTVGLLSLVASVSGLWMYTLFIVLYTLFYTYMVVLVYNNKLITKVILPAVNRPHPVVDEEMEEHEDSELTETMGTIPEGITEEEYNQIFKERLTEWIANKGYLQKDLSVDDIANTMGIDRDYLRYYFRTYIHTDFRTWRSELRIEESKRLMTDHPEYTFTRIAEIVGFNHRANFFNQFVKVEGMTPTEWRETNHEEEE